MLISRTYGFAYLHIPKCAGSSVRHQLQPLNEVHERFGGWRFHEEIGWFDAQHTPLARLRHSFPEDFQLLATLDVFAVCRDPVTRFISALAQRLREFRGRAVETFEPPEIRREVDEVIEHLEVAAPFPHIEFVHFARQSDYIELDGRRFVSFLYPIERLHRMLAELKERTGYRLDPSYHGNASQRPRVASIDASLRFRAGLSRSLLPARLYRRLRDKARRRLMTTTNDALSRTVLGYDDAMTFIEQFYAQDFRIHWEALASPEAMEEGNGCRPRS